MTEDKNPIQAADRIFGILELLADRGEMGLLELSQELKLNKSTVHRMLASLIHMGYACQIGDSQKYILTYKIVTLAGKMLDRADILTIARPYLTELSEKCGETVHLVQRDGNSILYIDKVEARKGSIRMVSYIGMMHPMYCSGVGKAILASLADQEVSDIFQNSLVEKKTAHTITDLTDLQKEIFEIRTCGYAIDDEENELGVRCVAASIHEAGQKANYALSISGPVSRMTPERVRELSVDLLKIRDKIAVVMGYQS